MDCGTLELLEAASSVMPNIVLIKFVNKNTYPPSLGPTCCSPVPFPHLKHLSGLTAEVNLIKMVWWRKSNGILLAALDISEYRSTLRHIAELRRFMGKVKVWDCTKLLKYWTSNLIFNIWQGSGHHVPMSTEWFFGGMRADWTGYFLRNYLVGCLCAVGTTTFSDIHLGKSCRLGNATRHYPMVFQTIDQLHVTGSNLAIVLISNWLGNSR
jgi:hypothetical protein